MLKNYFDEEKYEEIKNSDIPIYKALEISTVLFENDLDKGGNPYFKHLIYVYIHVSTRYEKTLALLHDVLEDKDVTREDLLDVGFSPKFVKDIESLTRVKPMEYSDYIDNLIENGSVEALHVKLADLEHNMDISRIANPTVKDIERIKKRYIPTHEKIMNRLEEIENDRHKINKGK